MNARVDETCSCGATFIATGPAAFTGAAAWRNSHRHDRGVGICGMSMHVKGSCGPDPICDLPANHDGWHETSNGTRWGFRRYQTQTEGNI